MALEQEEISIKAAPNFSKGWNGDNCRSDNQRQHNILSREGFVLEITFVHLTDCSYWLIKKNQIKQPLVISLRQSIRLSSHLRFQ